LDPCSIGRKAGTAADFESVALLSVDDSYSEGSLRKRTRLDSRGSGENAPRERGFLLSGLGLLIDGGLGDIGQRFVRRLLFLKGLLQK
jgi:hypothetical protein